MSKQNQLRNRISMIGFIFCALFLNPFLKSDAFATITFQQDIATNQPDQVRAVRQTQDGGYIFIGSTKVLKANGLYFDDVWMVKTDEYGNTCVPTGGINCSGNINGKVVFAKTYPTMETSYGGTGYDVRQTVDGGYIIAAGNQTTGWIIKTDANGQTCDYSANGFCTGAGTFSVMLDPLTVVYSIQQTTPDNGYIVCGDKFPQYFNSYGEAMLVKIQNNGTIVFNQQFGAAGQSDGCRSVQQVANGYVMFGHTQYGPANYNAWMVQTDLSGNTCDYVFGQGTCYDSFAGTFAKTYGNVSTTMDYKGTAGLATWDGGFLMAGNITYGATAQVFLVKTDAIGNEVWNRSYGVSYAGQTARSVTESIDHGFVLAGDSYAGNRGQHLWMFKVNASGEACDILGGGGVCDNFHAGTFSKQYGGTNTYSSYVNGTSIIQTSDSGFIVAGYRGFWSTRNDNWYIVKTNQFGEVSESTFERVYGAGEDMHTAQSVRQTSDGGYFMAGTKCQWGDEYCETSIWVVKTDDLGRSCNDNLNPNCDSSSNGKIVFTREFTVPLNTSPHTYVKAGIPTSDGGYVILAFTRGFTEDDFDGLVIKTDNHGNTCDYLSGNGNCTGAGVFVRRFNYSPDDQFNSVQQTSDGGYIICGQTQWPTTDLDAWLIKLDSNGDTCDFSEDGNCAGAGIFVKRFGTNNDKAEYCTSVKEVLNGSNVDGYLLFGSRWSDLANTDYDAFMIKTDNQGNTCNFSSGNCSGTNQFVRTYAWLPDFSEYVTAGQKTSNGGYMLAGHRWNSQLPEGTENDMFLLIADANGNELWRQFYGMIESNERAYSAQETSDGGYLLAGLTTQYFNPDVWLVKTDANGFTCEYSSNSGVCTGAGVFVAKLGRSYGEFGYSAQQTADGGYVVAGLTTSFSGVGQGGFYLVKADPLGAITRETEQILPEVQYFVLREPFTNWPSWTNVPQVTVQIDATAPPPNSITRWIVNESSAQPTPDYMLQYGSTTRPTDYTFQDQTTYGFRIAYGWVLSDDNVVSEWRGWTQRTMFYGVFGNANLSSDGRVNILDVILIQRHSVGLIQLQGTALEVADTYKDLNRPGVINILDVIAAQKKSVGIAGYEYLPIVPDP